MTIFTPTYNRAYRLRTLYESLTCQTNNSFKWLIVDDGSTDGTEDLVREFINENKIEIVYVMQKNMGKHAAHNMGNLLTDTELFLCVDSDDSLVPEAVEEILLIWENKRENDKICGIIGPRSNARLDLWPKKALRGTLSGLYDKHGFIGDTLIVFRTDIIKRYFFPVFKDERFLSESVIYEEIDKDFEYIYTNKVLYIGEYLEDGLTNNYKALIRKNPIGTAYSFKHTAAFHTNTLKKVKAYGSYLAMKQLYDISENFNNLKVSFVYRIGGFLLKSHYMSIFKEMN